MVSHGSKEGQHSQVFTEVRCPRQWINHTETSKKVTPKCAPRTGTMSWDPLAPVWMTSIHPLKSLSPEIRLQGHQHSQLLPLWCQWDPGASPEVKRRSYQRNSTAFNKAEDRLLYRARLPVLLKPTPQPPTRRLSL